MSTTSGANSNSNSSSGKTNVAHDLEFERNRNPITLTRFLLAEQKKFAPHSTGNFAMLLQSIQLAVKVIASATHKAGIANLYGVAGTENTSGDEQKKLDVLANDVFVNCCTFSDEVYIIGSEEEDRPIIVDNTKGGYAIVFDPLDGSSNIDCNVGVGSIWGIYQKQAKTDKPTSVEDLLRPGNELIAAGYALYGPATTIVLSTGLGVHGFTLDPSIGEFILTHKDMKIPPRGKIYSINEGNATKWDAPTREYVERERARQHRGRYIGSMVADVHRTIMYGGIFAYPADANNPGGKLRLLYECNPMAFLIEQAGGRATTGSERILDIKPTKLHQRCPIWLGSREMVAEIEGLYAKHGLKAGQGFPPNSKSQL